MSPSGDWILCQLHFGLPAFTAPICRYRRNGKLNSRIWPPLAAPSLYAPQDRPKLWERIWSKLQELYLITKTDILSLSWNLTRNYQYEKYIGILNLFLYYQHCTYIVYRSVLRVLKGTVSPWHSFKTCFFSGLSFLVRFTRLFLHAIQMCFL